MKQKSVMAEALASCRSIEEVAASTLRVQQAMSDEFMAVINSYHSADWPILAAVMKVSVEGLVAQLPPPHRLLYELTVAKTSAVTAKVEVRNNE